MIAARRRSPPARGTMPGGAGDRWLALGVLASGRIAMGLQFQSVGAVSPLLAERLGIGGTELGVLIGLFALPGIVLALPGGLLGRRLGDRQLVLGGLVMMAVGSALIGEASGFHAAAAGRLLTAVGAVLLNVLGAKMVADWFTGREIVWAMAVYVNSWPVGNALAAFTLPVIAGHWGVAAAFRAAGAAAALGAIAVAIACPGPAASEAAPPAGAPIGLSRREMSRVSLSAMPWMLYNVGYAVMLGFLPALLVRGGIPLERAGVLVGLALVLFVGSAQVGGAAAQWLVRPGTTVVVGLVPFAVALAWLPYAPALPCLLVIGVLAGLPAAALVSAPTLVLGPASRAPGMGLFYTWYYAGMAVLPGIAGWLEDVLGRAAAIEFAAAAIGAALAFDVAFRRLVVGDTAPPRTLTVPDHSP